MFGHSHREKIIIPNDKPFIIRKGEAKDKTQVVWGDHETLAQSPTFKSSADNIVIKSMSFTVRNNFIYMIKSLFLVSSSFSFLFILVYKFLVCACKNVTF